MLFFKSIEVLFQQQFASTGVLVLLPTTRCSRKFITTLQCKMFQKESDIIHIGGPYRLLTCCARSMEMWKLLFDSRNKHSMS